LPTFWTVSKKFFVSVETFQKVIKRKEKKRKRFLSRNCQESLQKREYPICKIIAFEKSLPAPKIISTFFKDLLFL